MPAQIRAVPLTSQRLACRAVGDEFAAWPRQAPRLQSSLAGWLCSASLAKPEPQVRRSKDWLNQALRDLDHARASIELGHFEW